MPEYNAIAKLRQTLSCDWENITDNRAKINDIDRNLNAMFESIKTFKNVVKFVRLQNERHYKELGIIMSHLRKMSKKSSLGAHLTNNLRRVALFGGTLTAFSSKEFLNNSASL